MTEFNNEQVKALMPVSAFKELYAELSLSNKPENETEGQRQDKILRRELISNALGIKVSELDKYLKFYNKTHGQTYIEEVQNTKKEADKSNMPNASEVIGAAGTVASVASIIPNPYTEIIAIICKVINLPVSAIEKNMKKSPEESVYYEALKKLMPNLEELNNILTSDNSEISQKIRTMSKKDFKEFSKTPEFEQYKQDLLDKLKLKIQEQNSRLKLDTTNQNTAETNNPKPNSPEMEA